MELLDVYDENKNYIGTYPRDEVHQSALWHNTVHCWLYDQEGNIYFQKRADEKKLYTTASGHVMAGETIKQAFGREIKEEIGIDIDYEQAELVNINIFKMDKQKKDGTMFRDRAFANVYVYKIDSIIPEFQFAINEVEGLVKVNAKETLNLLTKEQSEISGYQICDIDHKIEVKEVTISFSDFLVYSGETALGKYGDILRKVIELNQTK